MIWLRLPFHVVFRRLLGRTLRRAWTCEMLWGTNRESWRKTFLHRDSILLWSLTSWKPHVRRTAEALRTIPNQASVVTLRSPREVGAFVGALEGQEPGRDAIGGDA